MSELHQLSLTGMLAALSRGECSAQEIVESCLRHIDACDEAIQAWTHLARPDFRGAPPSAGPLRGLPIGVKDTFDVAGLPAERGSPIWRGRRPEADAACVSHLLACGARVIGKTATTEFAYFTPGPTGNPHRLDHTPGGSSSGSAAAVAARMVPVALGSQTAASVIRPAAYCGVAAYVASVGLTSLRGVMPLAQSFDALGVFARDVADLQVMHSILRPQRVSPPLPAARPLVLLAIDGSQFGEVEPAMQQAFAASLDRLRRLGIRVLTPDDLDAPALADASQWPPLHRQLMACEAAQTLAFEYHRHRDGLSPALAALVEEGRQIDAGLYDRLVLQQRSAARELAAAMDSVDAVIAPAAPGAAPAGLEATGRPDQSRAWQLFGLPQVCLPAGLDAAGMPLGVQLVGHLREDARLLALARWLQDELGWVAQPPATVLARRAPA